MNKRGHFFVFEGIDGSGKTTQIHLLQKRIEQQGVRCMETKEPTDGPIGSLLRQCLTGRMNIDEYSISAMFAADRLDHLQNETDGLCHKIEEGISVISDRYVFSNYAYQSVSVPLEWLVQLNAQAAKLLRPDCHIFIDVMMRCSSLNRQISNVLFFSATIYPSSPCTTTLFSCVV